MGKLQKAAPIRRLYVMKLGLRILVLLFCTLIYCVAPQELAILEGWNFFQGFSLLHLLWGVWVLDMLQQILPFRTKLLALGSQKWYAFRYQERPYQPEQLRHAIRKNTRYAYRVFFLWAALIGGLLLLYHRHILQAGELFLISVFFYVCDLICVVAWCPFRLIMHNRCCTTCRIFNWDHLMMFTPFIPLKGFFPQSLLWLSILAWLVWEYSVWKHPERFWEGSNAALQCKTCSDHLCTQYRTCPHHRT